MLAVQVDWDLFGRYANVMSPTAMVGVALTVGVCIWLVFRLRARFREDTGRADDKLEMLTQFRELRQQGELTEEEYRLIKSRLAREAGTRFAINPTGPRLSAESADRTVQQERGTEKTGETVHDGGDLEESRSPEEPPNQNSAP